LNPVTLKKSTTTESNAPAILESMRYCQAAVAELEAMRLWPGLDPDPESEAMKKGVPRIDVFHNLHGGKAYGKGAA